MGSFELFVTAVRPVGVCANVSLLLAKSKVVSGATADSDEARFQLFNSCFYECELPSETCCHRHVCPPRRAAASKPRGEPIGESGGPSVAPVGGDSAAPSVAPSVAPSMAPSMAPSAAPSAAPQPATPPFPDPHPVACASRDDRIFTFFSTGELHVMGYGSGGPYFFERVVRCAAVKEATLLIVSEFIVLATVEWHLLPEAPPPCHSHARRQPHANAPRHVLRSVLRVARYDAMHERSKVEWVCPLENATFATTELANGLDHAAVARRLGQAHATFCASLQGTLILPRGCDRVLLCGGQYSLVPPSARGGQCGTAHSECLLVDLVVNRGHSTHTLHYVPAMRVARAYHDYVYLSDTHIVLVGGLTLPPRLVPQETVPSNRNPLRLLPHEREAAASTAFELGMLDAVDATNDEASSGVPPLTWQLLESNDSELCAAFSSCDPEPDPNPEYSRLLRLDPTRSCRWLRRRTATERATTWGRASPCSVETLVAAGCDSRRRVSQSSNGATIAPSWGSYPSFGTSGGGGIHTGSPCM